MSFVILFSLLVAPSTFGCAVNVEKYLAQDFVTFDQSQSGWRELAKNECYRAAAHAIEIYIERSEKVRDSDFDLLYWHAGQMYAYNNQYNLAIDYFQKAYASGDAPIIMRLKAEAVIAFLKRDKITLVAVRDRMIALPEPNTFRASVERLMIKDPNATAPDWPLGLERVERYISCFDDPYRVAYVCDKDTVSLQK